MINRMPSLRSIRDRASISFTAVISVLRRKSIVAYWSKNIETRRNFGDAINPLLIERFLGKPAVHLHRVAPLIRRPTVYMTGSILDNLNNSNAVILGAGFKREGSSVRRKPLAVLAVRGPLSRANLLGAGVHCPEVYCDPALLLPRIFPRKRVSGGIIGVVPHYVDKELVKSWHLDPRRYRLIDIEAEVESVIDEIVGCDFVLSSSLHGIIASHAYGVPAAWIDFSGCVVGGGFKFRDYYHSVGQKIDQPALIGSDPGLLGSVVPGECPDTSANVGEYLSALEIAVRLIRH